MLFVDSSALVKRYIDEPGRDLVVEATLILHRLAAGPRQAERLLRLLQADWDAFHVVPVDDRCLHTAAELGANFGLRLAHAVQLAAADRLPRPVRFLTLDDRQIAAAVALDLDVIA